MNKYVPPCMDKNQKTTFPKCKSTCSGIVAAGCHGFYLSSDAAKALDKAEKILNDRYGSGGPYLFEP